MAKRTKRILLTFVALTVILLASAILVPILFKDRIEAAVKSGVNRNINAVVDWGEWDITILRSFPDLTVEVADVKVGNLAPFEGIDLARVDRILATIDIGSLWREKIDIKRIGLVRPAFHVKVLEDGRANWDIAKPDSAVEAAPSDTAGAFHIGLREYWIEDGSLLYDDASLTYTMDLHGLDHRGTGDFTQELFVLSTTTQVDTANVMFDGIRYLRNVRADIKADVDMDMANMRFTFKENEATINRLPLGFNGWLAMPGDDMDMDITWNTKKTDFGTLLSLVPAEFATDLSGVEVSGGAGFSGYVKGIYNDSIMPAFGIVVDVDKGRFKYPDLPGSMEDVFVDLDIQCPQGGDMDGMVIDLKRFAMRMAGNPVEARMHLTSPMSDPVVDAEVKADLDLASVGKVVPMKEELKGRLSADIRMKGRTSDVENGRYDRFKADGRLVLVDMDYVSDSLPQVGISSMQFDFSPQYLALTSFDGHVGTSTIRASGRIDNYIQWWLKDSTLKGGFEMSADRFDLNELMGPPAPEEVASTQVDTTSLAVIEVPGSMDLRLGMSAKEVIYDNITLSGVRGAMHVHDRRVDLQDVHFDIFGGSVTMSGGYDTRNVARPTIDLSYAVEEVDIEQTVKYMESVQKMAPIARTCKGRFSTDLSMTAALDQHMQPVMSTLAGRGTFRTKSVRIDGFQPLVDIAKALKLKGIENTTLQNVVFNYKFEEGRMITEPFNVNIDRIKAQVGGSTAFADQAIDYDLKARVPTDMFGSGAAGAVAGLLGKANKAVGGDFQVPAELDLTAKITGTIEKPIIKPVFAGGTSSIKEVVVAEIKQELNEQIDKAKGEALARAREEAARLVAEAQQQAERLKEEARQAAARLKGEAYKAADDALAKVANPLAKMAAQAVAKKAKEEADKKEKQAVAEADERADALVNAARKRGDELIAKAEAVNTTVK